MHADSTPRWRLLLMVAVSLVLVVAMDATAQTTTDDQLQIFQGLTPEQQKAVLQQLDGQQRAGSTVEAAEPARQPAPESESQRLRDGTEDETLRAEDTVVIEISLPRDAKPAKPSTPTEEAAAQRRLRLVAAMDAAGQIKLEELISTVLSRNPYKLDRNARLNLPGFAPIELGGLSEDQATQRLSFEPVLQPLEVHLSRLPLAKTGVGGLKPYGYDLFDSAQPTFSPIADLPVPADYEIGPGDEFNVQLFGLENRNFSLIVNRDGVVNFPELGPIRVSGMTFSVARQAIESRVTQQRIGVQVNVSVRNTRTIQVYVFGEVRRQGSYTINGFATMTAALFASGGVNRIGSLRDIQLKRQGVVVGRFDLYDMLLRGDKSDDARLLPGDVIFIPTVGDTVSVDGEVKRPAIYELRGEASVADVVQLAGGFTPDADRSRASLTRIDASSRRVVLDVNLAQPAGSGQNLRNGDVLRVVPLRPQIDAGVMLEGHVHRPGPFAWREGLRLTDVIGSVDELKPGADQHYIFIRRESGPDRRISVLGADLAAALAAPNSPANVPLSSRDRLTVFDLGPGRERIIQPVVDELKLQSELSRPTELVRVSGRVKVPGEYPLEPGMRVSALLRAGGNLDSAAYGSEAELTRYVVTDEGMRQTELIIIDLAAVRRGDTVADVALRPFDSLMVKETPDWTEQESVTLRGEVRFPGTYSIRRGQTLRQLLDQAGGLTSLAFPEGSAFTRAYRKVLEQEQLDRLADRMRKDLATLALQAANGGQAGASGALLQGQSLLAQLQGSKATGRMVLDLPGLLTAAAGSAKDVELRDGDELVIPKRRQEVTVIGEVQSATSHLFTPDLDRNAYISMSGGTTRKADRRQIYVVRADGSVATSRGSWFARNYNVAIRPGDTIVVPLDTERMPRLPFWQAVTQILYNVAVSVAAVNAL